MEKLIELLNEYRKIDYVPEKMKNVLWVNEEKIISKKYWFIEWLVENDKIDLYMLDSKAHNTDIIIELYKYENLKDKDSKRLLMLLSISDTPIEFLCSMLK